MKKALDLILFRSKAFPCGVPLKLSLLLDIENLNFLIPKAQIILNFISMHLIVIIIEFAHPVKIIF